MDEKQEVLLKTREGHFFSIPLEVAEKYILPEKLLAEAEAFYGAEPAEVEGQEETATPTKAMNTTSRKNNWGDYPTKGYTSK